MRRSALTDVGADSLERERRAHARAHTRTPHGTASSPRQLCAWCLGAMRAPRNSSTARSTAHSRRAHHPSLTLQS